MKRIKNIFPLVLLCLGFSSCLEDDYLTGDNHEAQNVIDFLQQPDAPASASEIYPVYIRAVPISAEEEVVIPISYSGTNQAPEDIVVNVEVDAAMIAAYNAKYLENAIAEAVGALVNPTPEEIADETEHATEEAEAEFFDLIPTSIYSIPSQVTIKKGERSADLVLKLKADQFNFNFKYGLPLKLTSSQATVSSNFGSAIFYVGAKNQWDGTYNYRTSAITSLLPNRNVTVTLETAGPRRVRLMPGLLGNYTNEVYYTINADNSITVECPSLGVQTPQDPRSKYDPATKTLHVFWKQGNGGRTFEETIRYLRGR